MSDVTVSGTLDLADAQPIWPANTHVSLDLWIEGRHITVDAIMTPDQARRLGNDLLAAAAECEDAAVKAG